MMQTFLWRHNKKKIMNEVMDAKQTDQSKHAKWN